MLSSSHPVTLAPSLLALFSPSMHHPLLTSHASPSSHPQCITLAPSPLALSEPHALTAGWGSCEEDCERTRSNGEHDQCGHFPEMLPLSCMLSRLQDFGLFSSLPIGVRHDGKGGAPYDQSRWCFVIVSVWSHVMLQGWSLTWDRYQTNGQSWHDCYIVPTHYANMSCLSATIHRRHSIGL